MINETALVLVAIVPDKRDLDIARLLGWYRIPLRTAPKIISVDYLAFYQTSAFDENERWQITYYAPVIGHELTTRGELLVDEKDHPRAHEEYFKLVLGPIQKLTKPIPAHNWKRITFFYTTGEHLWGMLHPYPTWLSVTRNVISSGNHSEKELLNQMSTGRINCLNWQLIQPF